MNGTFQYDLFAWAIQQKMTRDRLSVRQAARQIGVSFSTLSRSSHLHNMSITSFTAIVAWLELPVTDFFSPGVTPRDKWPRFGDLVENTYASLDSPARRARFIRKVKITGRLNPGLWWEVTNGDGDIWMTDPKNCRIPVDDGYQGPLGAGDDE